jgi:4-hydroxy-tetrahydrodipicolinate synthase
MGDIIESCPADFAVLSGDDNFTLPLLAIGGAGVISVVSNVVPADMAGLVDAFAAGDIKKSKSLHYKMSVLMEALFIEVNPTPVKAALAMMGKIKEEYRLPLCKMADANREKLKRVLTDYALI